MRIKVNVENVELVSAKVRKLAGYEPIMKSCVTKSLADMKNRADVLTKQVTGELLRSCYARNVGSLEGEFGYTKKYAPFVEYGHRVVIHGRNVGWCRARPYLAPNAQAQQSIFEADCNRAMDMLTRGF